MVEHWASRFKCRCGQAYFSACPVWLILRVASIIISRVEDDANKENGKTTIECDAIKENGKITVEDVTIKANGKTVVQAGATAMLVYFLCQPTF